jgi:hypothetical protein
MRESRKLRPVEPVSPLRYVPVEEWVQRHRDARHHPYAAPTKENPERWDCECGHIWRILTLEQITRKFAHLKHAAREAEQARRRAAKLREDLRTTIRSPSHSTLSLAERYATGRPRRG